MIGTIESNNKIAIVILKIRLRLPVLRNLCKLAPSVNQIPRATKPIKKYMIMMMRMLDTILDWMVKAAIAPIAITQAFGFTH